MFIVFEGVDGSGKGTQIKLVNEALQKMGKKVKILDYPRYGEKSAFAVEKYLNGEYGVDISAKKASIFYAIDRFDDSIEFKKDMGNYDFILSNRYVSSNMLHQAGKIKDKEEREDFLEWLADLEYNIFEIPKPDKVIFLNVNPDISQKLVLNKEKREYLKNDKKMDLHEADLNHLKDAYDSAIDIVSRYPDWVNIDCTENSEIKSMQEITNMILKEIL